MSKTVYMMKGLPASGKSTRAKQMLSEMGNGNAKRVNKDDLRAMLDDGHWSKDNEKFLLGVRDYIVSNALNAGKHVIVDDTNLAPKHEARMRDLAKNGEAAFEIVDFTGVSLEECLSRDQKRPNYVGEKVIRGMYEQFIRPVVASAPQHNPELPNAVLVDIDGTVAQMDGRGPFEWGRVAEDQVRSHVWTAVLGFRGARIVFLSGRDSCCREATQGWINTNLIEPDKAPLFMRPAGDMRKDSIVKRELYKRHIEGQYNVVAIFDDRPQMIRCWQEMGFKDRIFNVGDGTEF